GPDDEGGAARCFGRAGELQHLAAVDMGGGVGDGLEVVDQVHGLEAEVVADAAGRQRPGQIGGDDGAVGQRVAGGGDDALVRAGRVGAEVGKDRAEPG